MQRCKSVTLTQVRLVLPRRESHDLRKREHASKESLRLWKQPRPEPCRLFFRLYRLSATLFRRWATPSNPPCLWNTFPSPAVFFLRQSARRRFNLHCPFGPIFREQSRARPCFSGFSEATKKVNSHWSSGESKPWKLCGSQTVEK